MKKLLSIILTIALMLTVLPFGLFTIPTAAATSGTTGDCTWTLDGTTLTISGNGAMQNYLDKGAPWFELRNEISEIMIGSGVTSIGDYAFYGCTGLTKVTIPDNVKKMGKAAFCGCINITSITLPFVGDALDDPSNPYFGFIFAPKPTLDDEINDVVNDTQKRYSKYVPKSLKKVYITKEKNIGAGAFENCEGLEYIRMPDSVTSIGAQAFRNCTSLSIILLSKSLIYVGKEAFANTVWYDLKPDGIVYIGKLAYDFIGTCEGEVVIEDGTLSICDFLFYNCTGLTSITIPDSVTSIGNSAFENCTGLTSITIPDSVTSIGNSAFYYCKRLTSITIPDSVTSIGNWSFSGSYIDTVYYGGTQAQWSELKNKPSYKKVIYYNAIGIKVTPPIQVEYMQGEELSLVGGKVYYLFNDETTAEAIELDNSAVKVSGYNKNKSGTQDVTVEYEGYKATFRVTVNPKPENKTEFAGGNGYEETPYLVSTKEHLKNVSKYPDAYFKQISDIEFTDADFAKGGPFYNSGYGWQPIGKTSSTAFTGIYDGGNFKVKGLKVTITGATTAYGGLFGYCKGTLKNIIVENGDISVSGSTVYAGGIVGYHTTGSIENCKNINTRVKAVNAGGIVGYSQNSKIIKNCTNSGNIDGTYIGGIVGKIVTPSISGGISVSESDAIIIGCENSGDMIKTGTSGAYIGGIAGWHSGGVLIVYNCSNSGKIYAEGSDLSSISLGGCPCVGGILGFTVDSYVFYCDNTADIYGDMSGGIVGYGASDIEHVTNEGNISGRTSVGGIMGYQSGGNINECINTGNILGVRYYNGKVVEDYSTNAGGILGETKSGYTATIYKCRNTGKVKNATNTGGIAGIAKSVNRCYSTGEVVGYNYAGGIVAKLVSSGNVYNSYNTGKISGINVGGIIAVLSSGSVSTSYNVGKLSMTSSSGYLGGIVGEHTGGAITDCYYIDNASEGVGHQGYNVSTTADTIKLTVDSMKNSNSFSGFDFSSVWYMANDSEYYYPVLYGVDMIYVPYTPGDVTGDDKINSLDGLMLLRYLNGWNINIASPEAMDVNGDGKVNSLDGLMLMRYLNGWNITLG